MSMRIALPLILSLAVVGVASAQTNAVAAGTAMKPGLWEITQVTDTPATASKRTVTSQNCYSADDVKAVSRILPEPHEAPLKCQNRDIKVDKDGAIEWHVVCTGPGATSNGTGRMTIAGETFAGHVDFASKSAGKAGKAAQTVSGKWLSACK